MSESINIPQAENSGDMPNIPMDPMTVRMFHMFSDVDSQMDAQHHTLGPGVTQAASGTHSHNGSDSAMLFSGTITGSRGGNAAVASLIQQLAQQTGLIDGTTT